MLIMQLVVEINHSNNSIQSSNLNNTNIQVSNSNSNNNKANMVVKLNCKGDSYSTIQQNRHNNSHNKDHHLWIN